MKKRSWLVPVTGLLAIGALIVWRVVVVSGEPGHYYEFRHSHEGFVYPTSAVVQWVSIIIVELSIVSLAIMRAERVERACFVAAALFGFAFFALAAFAMHSPPYFGGFVIAQLFSGGWLLVAAFLVAMFGATSRHSLPRAVIASNGHDVGR